MRRWRVALPAFLVLAAGCSSGGGDAAQRAATTASTAAATTAAPTVTTAEPTCDFSEVPPEGQVTWLRGPDLMAATPAGDTTCLLRGVGGGVPRLQWSGDGAKVLVDGALRTAAGVQREFGQHTSLRLSRPRGRSVIEVADGKLVKYEAAAAPRDITFVDQPVEAIYHPAGRSIAASGVEDGTPVIRIADNLGRDPELLAVGETARSLTALAFTARQALLFVADHGDASHLHRLELESGALTTVATVPAPGRIADVTASPFPGGGVAWTEGTACGLVVTQDAAFIDVKGSPVASARPVGWLPDRSLVARTGCGDASDPGDLYVVAAGRAPRLLAEGVGVAAVRAALPEPEGPPRAIPAQAPA